jgi:hypothetical protein
MPESDDCERLRALAQRFTLLAICNDVIRMTARKNAGSKRATDERQEKDILFVRVDPELIEALDKEAQAIGKAAGGLYVSRANAARVVLRRALAHHLAPEPSPDPQEREKR